MTIFYRRIDATHVQTCRMYQTVHGQCVVVLATREC